LATCIAPVRFAIPNSITEQNVRVGSRHAVDLATYIKHEPSKTAGHHGRQPSNRP
jgi:cytochrome c